MEKSFEIKRNEYDILENRTFKIYLYYIINLIYLTALNLNLFKYYKMLIYMGQNLIIFDIIYYSSL
jgi:hypothetical protein